MLFHHLYGLKDLHNNYLQKGFLFVVMYVWLYPPFYFYQKLKIGKRKPPPYTLIFCFLQNNNGYLEGFSGCQAKYGKAPNIGLSNIYHKTTSHKHVSHK